MRNRVKSLIKNSFRKVGIDISYLDNSDRNPHMYINALKGAVSVKKPLDIVQVGANDGKYNDPIFDFVKAHKELTEIILIEPQEELIPYLAENYEYHPSAEIYNKAIGENTSILQLYRIREEYWSEIDAGYGENWPDYRAPTGVTTSDREQLSTWVSEKTNLDPETVIEQYDVEVVQPNHILNQSNIMSDVDLLQVDTEGMDDEVVYSFLENDIYPGIINLEVKHLDTHQLKNYSKKLSQYGYKTLEYIDGEKLSINMADN